MRKEAINTFGEGLIMDLHPLTTPSNVLTNCLNGTIITYNGNEFVLQNDMGNGEVHTAYLDNYSNNLEFLEVSENIILELQKIMFLKRK